MTPALAAEGFRITPSISVRETFTDNVGLQPNDVKRGDLVTEVMPAVSVDIRGPRLTLRGAYQFDALKYARASEHDSTRNALDANGTLVAVEKLFFVDAQASIAQSVISAFGPRPTSDVSVTSNRAETRTYRVSPYLRGAIGGRADYELRYSFADSQSTGTSAGRSRVGEWRAQVNGEAGAQFDWAVDAMHQATDNGNGTRLHLENASARLTYIPDPQWRVRGRAGAERNDYESVDSTTRALYGVGADWAPTARTSVSGEWEHRFFGSGWRYSARHRTPSFVFSFTDSRDVTTEAQRRSLPNTGVAFDLLFSALATRIPDPAERALEAERLLRQGSIPSDLNVPLEFLTSGAFIGRSQQVSVGLVGLRNTVTLSASRSRRDRIGGAVDAQTTSNPGIIVTGLNLAASHQMTPTSSITVLGNWARSRDAVDGNRASVQRGARLLYTREVSRNVSLVAEARHVQFTTEVQPAQSDYRETAVTATVSVKF